MLRVTGLGITTGRRELQAPAVVVHDSNNNPIALLVEHQPGVTEVFTQRDAEFNDRLRLLSLPPTTRPVFLNGPPVPAGWQPVR